MKVTEERVQKSDSEGLRTFATSEEGVLNER